MVVSFESRRAGCHAGALLRGDRGVSLDSPCISKDLNAAQPATRETCNSYWLQALTNPAARASLTAVYKSEGCGIVFIAACVGLAKRSSIER